MAEDKELAEEGMMFVGDKGKILGGFRGENSQLIPEATMRAYRKANNLPEPAPRQRGGQQGRDPSARNAADSTAEDSTGIPPSRRSPTIPRRTGC
jgi:hypothetical protein